MHQTRSLITIKAASQKDPTWLSKPYFSHSVTIKRHLRPWHSPCCYLDAITVDVAYWDPCSAWLQRSKTLSTEDLNEQRRSTWRHAFLTPRVSHCTPCNEQTHRKRHHNTSAFKLSSLSCLDNLTIPMPRTRARQESAPWLGKVPRVSTFDQCLYWSHINCQWFCPKHLGSRRSCGMECLI